MQTSRTILADPMLDANRRYCGSLMSREMNAKDQKLGIAMMADRILGLPSAEAGERRSRAGILIPATANEDRRLDWAEVVAIGPTVRTVEESDKVLYHNDDCFEVEIGGKDYIILREREVHAVASDRQEGETGLYL